MGCYGLSRWKRLARMLEESKGFVSVRDLVIAAVWALGGRAPRKDYIHKLLYIVSKERGDLASILGFEEYKRGAWSEVVADAMDSLIDKGVLDSSRKGIIITAPEYVESSLSRLDRRLVELLRREGSFIGKLSYDEMLLYVYVMYGGYSRSEEKDRVFSRRKQLSIRLLQRGLISVGLAARLAGMSYQEFIKYLREKGIRPFEAEENDIDRAKKMASVNN